jgi:[ribosomal protein S5]-alanine N-acetyltransferase
MKNLKKELLPIETQRLTLRLLEPEEADVMVQYVTDNREHLQPWEPLRSEVFYTRSFWYKELMRRYNDFYTGEGAHIVILPKGNEHPEIVGVCNFTNIMRGAFQACYLGYSVHHRFEGRGIMYEALSRAVEFVLNHFRLHRIMANYIPRNERSGRLLRRLGFYVEGYAYDFLRINGKWEDHVLTSFTVSRKDNDQ